MLHDWLVIHVTPIIMTVLTLIANLLILLIPFAAGYFVARWRYIESKQLKVAAWVVTAGTLVWMVVVVFFDPEGFPRSMKRHAAGYLIARWRYRKRGLHV
jgi:FlaA1/EpsC-like NDP-sugar epimerase